MRIATGLLTCLALIMGAPSFSQSGDNGTIEAAIVSDAIENDTATAEADRPKRRPTTLGEIFGIKAKPKPAAKFCKNKALVGETIDPISKGACGIKEPVRLTEVAGVKLINGAVVNCDTANTLTTWLEKSAKKQLKRKGGGLVAVKVAASYSCRNRNNSKRGKLSEHALGNAIDISEFRLESGTTLTVLKNWNGKYSKQIQRMHKDACKYFGTVLGPRADKHHKDHFHFDVAKRRSGSYCR